VEASEYNMPTYEMAIRLVAAVFCGAIVGFDRQRRGHAAGLRTHMLVALGSAAFAIISILVAEEYNPRFPDSPPVDPLRNISYIIGGIGFLCAGVIIQSRGRVLGLTTATGIWTVAAIGSAAGLGFYSLVVFTTVLAFLTLSILKRIESGNDNGMAVDDNSSADT